MVRGDGDESLKMAGKALVCQARRGDSMQLDLFQWDIIAVGNGYQALARLDFGQARKFFSQVLAVNPDHPAASRGQGETRFWEGVLDPLPDLAWDTALVCLWEHISAFSFDVAENHGALRQSLLRRLVAMFPGGDEGGRWFHPPDLCLGSLHLHLGEYAVAEKYLRLVLAHFPDVGILHRFLGDALWQQERHDAAHVAYVTALLLAPDTISAQTILSQPMTALIAEHGLGMAPIEGYFSGLLALVELPCDPGRTEARAYELLRQSELARIQGKHQEMVAARRGLKTLAPEILAMYLEWLVGR
jgi:tetratricopeptide (TPR) repeat protein